MDAIRIWAMAVCAAAIAASIAQLAAPEGKVQKAMRCVIGLFFVCCVMAPFAQGITTPAENLTNREEPQMKSEYALTQEIARQTADTFAENVRQIVTDVLADRQIFPEEIQVGVHVDEDSGIHINSLEIQLATEDFSSKEEILQLVKEETGITPEVWTGGDEVV